MSRNCLRRVIVGEWFSKFQIKIQSKVQIDHDQPLQDRRLRNFDSNQESDFRHRVLKAYDYTCAGTG